MCSSQGPSSSVRCLHHGPSSRPIPASRVSHSNRRRRISSDAGNGESDAIDCNARKIGWKAGSGRRLSSARIRGQWFIPSRRRLQTWNYEELRMGCAECDDQQAKRRTQHALCRASRYFRRQSERAYELIQWNPDEHHRRRSLALITSHISSARPGHFVTPPSTRLSSRPALASPMKGLS